MAAKKAVLPMISLVLMAGSFIPAVAQAGAFAGFVSTALYMVARDAVGGTKHDNLQTMDLAEATLSASPTARGGADITIVDDSALVPQDGPSGTALDVHEATKSSQISVYVVREGDTLSTIAQLFGVTSNTILWANDLKSPKDLKVGQQLVILPVAGIRYTVKNGGTLRDIVKKHGGNLEEAALYNGVDPDEELAAGTTVVVPDAELVIPAPTPKKKKDSGVRIAISQPSSQNAPSYAGYYMRPISGGTRTQGVHGYNAVDLAASVGTPIMASAGGQVIIAKASGYNGGYGKYVVIRHDNGTQTLYAHANEVTVNPGDQVFQGQTIAFVGNTGRSTGPHVHFEIRGAKNPF
jgi:murein DD-endopeptidase MepM/ murein hydrolase activator NlpD